MSDLWIDLLPLAIAAAVLPIQLTITILMLRTAGGRARAGGWVGGMTVVRLLQYALFGVLLERAMDDTEAGQSPAEGVLLLVVAVLLLVSAARKAANQPDEDAPPPRWLTVASTVSPARGFVMGAAVVGLSPKLWALSLGAIGAIVDAGLDPVAAGLAFVAWVVLAQSLHLLGLLGVAVAPATVEPLLERAGGALERHSRLLLIGASLVFGLWFLAKAAATFGFLPGA